MEIYTCEQKKNQNLDEFTDEVNNQLRFFNYVPGVKIIDVNILHKKNKLNTYYAVIKYRIIEKNN